MAKVQYTEAFEDFGSLVLSYSPEHIHTDMEASDGDTATFIDDNGGERIVLKGNNFAYLDGDLLLGTVKKVIFELEEGVTTVSVSGGDFNAKKLDNLLTEGADISAFLDEIYGGKDEFLGTSLQDLMFTGKGDDQIKSFGGNDSLNGEKGDDRMIGGGGSDHFFFMHEGKGGKDVVTDFDAKGGGDNQDYIAAQFEDVLSIKQNGDDVVLNFGGGNTLTLRDVDKSDIGESDFHIPL